MIVRNIWLDWFFVRLRMNLAHLEYSIQSLFENGRCKNSVSYKPCNMIVLEIGLLRTEWTTYTRTRMIIRGENFEHWICLAKNYNAPVVIFWTNMEIFWHVPFLFLLAEWSFNSNFKYEDELSIKSEINSKCKGHEWQHLTAHKTPLWPLAWAKMEDIHFSYL